MKIVSERRNYVTGNKQIYIVCILVYKKYYKFIKNEVTILESRIKPDL